jgi:hypothetical protein
MKATKASMAPGEVAERHRRIATAHAPSSIAMLPFVILRGVTLALIYSVWYLVYYMLCMFRPVTGMMVLAAIVMLPMSIVVFAHPEAARGMPFWVFGLMSIGFVAAALGYTLFVDRITPPGAEDPFERYRRSRR